MKVSDFLDNELVDYASYSCLRAIASYIDGFKNAHRKVVHVLAGPDGSKNTKISTLAGIIQVKTEYLHGDISGSIVTLAQDYAGTNNLSLIKKEGNFGSRFNHSNSATRYIFGSRSDIFNKVIKSEDFKILVHQEFEGTKIEPRFFVPTIPLILVNGSEGIATGFAQKILPRNPKEIIKYLKGQKADLTPYFNGFKGSITKIDNSWLIRGSFKRDKKFIEITEIPVNYDLNSYLKVLDALEEQKKIKKYEDFSDNDIFNFKVYMDTSLDDEKIYELLKLQTRISENLTTIDENNKIKVFNTAEDLLDSYKEIKLKFTDLRKQSIISDLTQELRILISKYLFVSGIVDEKIIVNKQSKDKIVKQLENNKNIIKVDNSYDYLLRMQIHSLTIEKLKELKAEIDSKNNELKTISSKSNKDIWFEDLNDLLKDLK